MGAADDFAKETVNRLGPSAYLVNFVPSAVFVTLTWALFTSHLLPWAAPLDKVAPGIPSVVQSAKDVTVATLVLLVIVVFLGAVLLRPFQISAVQLLEGYWHDRFGLRLLEPLAVELQIRRLDAAEPWLDLPEFEAKVPSFREVAAAARARYRLDLRAARAVRMCEKYPLDRGWFLPTGLGNILRRGETTAGERYGLNTMVVYSRLYPHLGPSVNSSVANRLDLIDTTCTFTILFAVQSVLALPLVWRVDWWSLVPVGYLLFAGVAYRGARSVAERFNETLYVAFDLHRFDMLKALHRRLPGTPETELVENEELSRFLAQNQAWPTTRRRWHYDHGD
ncbi:hypothetical protein ACFQ1S_00775 [Kibdelosporangium lantanae]|uniref:Uncharacterized protein n=1 Tax=Kibdelosporangium lantanae TaxID=1497396 RepID=A0ABW3M2P9_9PSEU